MADPTPASQSLQPVYDTLHFLHRNKRVFQFKVRHAITARKYHETVEAGARQNIRRLNLRIQRELDAHPEIARGNDNEDWVA